MKFCSRCGHAVEFVVPPGDNRPRYVCPSCKTVHYENPRVVVGAIPMFGERVLLCRRAIEPRHGYWTLPAGFMENGETTAEGAARETLEEAGAIVRVGELFSVLDVPHVHQVHMFFRAELPEPVFSAGSESLEVLLFDEHEVPWADLAFRSVSTSLRWFFEDRAAGRWRVHTDRIVYPPKVRPPE